MGEQDLTEGVLLMQYGKEFLRCIHADRAHVEDLRNRGYLSELDYTRLERLVTCPVCHYRTRPLLTMSF